MHGGARSLDLARCLALSWVLVACATLESPEDDGLEETGDRAAEGEPDAGTDDGNDSDDAITDDDDDDDAADDDGSDGEGDAEGDGDGSEEADDSDDGSGDDGSDDSSDDGTGDDGTGDGTGDDGTGDDGTGDDGSDDGSDDGADDDGTPDLTCVTATVGSGSDGLIDNLDDGNNRIDIRDGRNGSWSVYDDETATALAPSNDGDLTTTMVAAGSYVAQVTGGPYTEWGASVGFSLRRGSQGEETCPYDASAYSGIRFKAKGTGSVRFKVRTSTTDADPDTYDGHGADLALTSSFTTYTLCFASLVQQYGTETTLEKNKMLNMHWQVDTGVMMALTLDEVTLISGACTNSP